MPVVDPNHQFDRLQSMNQKGLEYSKKKDAIPSKVLFIILGIVFAVCLAVVLVPKILSYVL